MILQFVIYAIFGQVREFIDPKGHKGTLNHL